MVAAASLAISAWGTWKSAQVADDQLSQSKDARDDDLRQQVSRITYWPEDGKVVIANRSYATAYAYMSYGTLEGVLDIGLLPPCTLLSFDRSVLNPPVDVDLAIVDASGRSWRRTSVGQIIAVNLEPPTDMEGSYEFGGDKPPVQFATAPAKGCG
ncbi:hypothetical protein [Streptomyces bobili]|uniref:Uncharacterized protein n=1 Tax=Streptomyces bobili TaxID=67280 RepID=A0ABZ1R4S3_9ACTN|nr:hypothetical protein [Streptomyces bobili]